MDEIQRLEARVRFLGVHYLRLLHKDAIITEHLYKKLIEAVDKEIDRLHTQGANKPVTTEGEA